MADLFLDTDVRIWYPYVARRCAESPYPAADLTAIFRGEVAPALEGNLLVVVGEWAGFDDDWVFSAISDRLKAWFRLPAFSGAGDRDWQAVLVLVNRLRTLEPEAWKTRVAVWSSLGHLFLDRMSVPDESKLKPLRAFGVAELEAMFREEMWPSYGMSVKAYLEHSPQMYPSARQIEANWIEWKRALPAS